MLRTGIVRLGQNINLLKNSEQIRYFGSTYDEKFKSWVPTRHPIPNNNFMDDFRLLGFPDIYRLNYDVYRRILAMEQRLINMENQLAKNNKYSHNNLDDDNLSKVTYKP